MDADRRLHWRKQVPLLEKNARVHTGPSIPEPVNIESKQSSLASNDYHNLIFDYVPTRTGGDTTLNAIQ